MANAPVRIRYANRSRWSASSSAWICPSAFVTASRSRSAVATRSAPASFVADRVGEGGQRAPAIDLALGALGFELVQNAREPGDLTLVELELVREEAQRTPHPERATPEPVTVALAARGRTAGPSTAATAATVSLSLPTARTAARRLTVAATRSHLARTPPRHHCWMHCLFSFRRGHQLPAGFIVVGGMPHDRLAPQV
jgi:hypothetical protein